MRTSKRQGRSATAAALARPSSETRSGCGASSLVLSDRCSPTRAAEVQVRHAVPGALLRVAARVQRSASARKDPERCLAQRKRAAAQPDAKQETVCMNASESCDAVPNGSLSCASVEEQQLVTPIAVPATRSPNTAPSGRRRPRAWRRSRAPQHSRHARASRWRQPKAARRGGRRHTVKVRGAGDGVATRNQSRRSCLCPFHGRHAEPSARIAGRLSHRVTVPPCIRRPTGCPASAT